MFPLGELTKPQVRDVARAPRPGHGREAGEPGDLLRARWRLRRRAPRAGRLAAEPGAVSMRMADAVGSHRGAAAYTVGQRQGLGVALGEPRYVASIDVAANIVQLGRREDLERSVFALDRRILGGRVPSERCFPGARCASATARHRCRRASSLPATRHGAAARWRVTLDRPAWAPAPGQAAVLYAVDEPARVLGGGRIEIIDVPGGSSREGTAASLAT